MQLGKTQRISTILKKLGLLVDGKRVKQFVVRINEEYILQKHWGKVMRQTDVVHVIELAPQLAGGGRGGSNPMQIVGMVVIAAAAMYTGGAVAASGIAHAGMWGGVAQTAVMMAGSLLLNALLPSADQGGNASSVNAVNQIGAQNNQARPNQVMPVQYGRVAQYPDLIAMPYNEFSNNNSFLFMLLGVTQGKMEIERISIENTDINNFEEVEYQIVNPHEAVTLFPDNVYTAREVGDLELALPELRDDGDMQVGYYQEYVKTGNERPKPYPWQDKIEYEYKIVSKPAMAKMAWRGGFIAVPSGVNSKKLAIDIGLPTGLAQMDEQGKTSPYLLNYCVQMRAVDKDNKPIGNWVNLTKTDFSVPAERIEWYGSGLVNNVYKDRPIYNTHEKIDIYSQEPNFFTRNFHVPAGRYEVRMARASGETMLVQSAQVLNSLHWIGLRSYMPSVKTYGNCTLIAVKIRATSNLNNNVARRVKVLGTRILPVWDGTNWTDKPTRSIAWAAADQLRNDEYALPVRDKYIDLDKLLELDATWNARGDTCNGLISEESTTAENLKKILECGRAVFISYAGITTFARNEPQRIPAQVFTPNNIVKDSFSERVIMRKLDDPDYAIVQYTDGNTWETKEVECVPAGSQKRRAVTVTFPFITNRAQAWREGLHRIAMDSKQRVFSSFQTEKEGLLLRYMNMISLSHTLIDGEVTGSVIDYDPATKLLTVDEYLPWNNIKSQYITLRSRTGGIQGTYRAVKVSDDVARLETTEAIVINSDNEEPTHFVFGDLERNKVVVLSVSPQSDGKVTIEAVNYDDYTHTAETTETMPPEVIIDTDEVENLTITWLSVRPSKQKGLYDLEVNMNRDATSYQFQVSTDNAATWADVGTSNVSLLTKALPVGNLKLRARAIGTFNGDWFVQDAVVSSDEVAIIAAPDLFITQSDVATGLRTFDITLRASEDLNYVSAYAVLQDGKVIWSGMLDAAQTATLSKTFQRQIDSRPGSPTEGQYIDTQTVVFTAYGYSNMQQKTATSTKSFRY